MHSITLRTYRVLSPAFLAMLFVVQGCAAGTEELSSSNADEISGGAVGSGVGGAAGASGVGGAAGSQESAGGSPGTGATGSWPEVGGTGGSDGGETGGGNGGGSGTAGGTGTGGSSGAGGGSAGAGVGNAGAAGDSGATGSAGSTGGSSGTTPDAGVINGPGTGTGLQGDYFNNMFLTEPPSTTHAQEAVDFTWPGSPTIGIPADNFSVRWTGEVEAVYSETYTFYLVSDDGVRLWVNGQEIVQNWTEHGVTEDSGNITLMAGQKYDIKLEFFEKGGEAIARLQWSSPSQIREVVPASHLYPY
jgi:PA14 domain